MAQLPPELTPEQKVLAEQAFLARAPKNTPRTLAQLAPQVLAEIAPELLPGIEEKALRLEMQRQRATTKRTFAWGDDGDGSMWFRGLLPHLEAAPLISVIESYVESDRRAAGDRFKATRATKPNPQIIRRRPECLCEERAAALRTALGGKAEPPPSTTSSCSTPTTTSWWSQTATTTARADGTFTLTPLRADL